MATTDNDNDTEQSVSMTPVNLEEEGNISKSLLSVLNAMQENLTSSNSMLRHLVERKRKSTEPDSISKRAKRDESRSRRSVNASEKALTSTSKEVIDSASEEASDSASEEANTKTPDEDTLSLLGDDSHHDFCSEDEEVNNDDLLSQITTSLSSAEDTGPPVSDKLSKLVNDKFQTEYTVEKRKEILQKYKVPINCNELFVPKVNSEIWTKLNANSKRSDIRTSVLQDTLVKVSSAIIVTVNDLLSHREKKTSPDYRTLIPRLTDSVALIGHVHKELSFKRRDAIRPYLNQEFKQACSRTLKPGKFLFGEDLPKTLQELKTTNRLMTAITPDNRKGPSKSKSYSNNQFRGTHFHGNQSKSFLVNRGGNAYPPKSNQQQNRFQHKKKFTKN